MFSGSIVALITPFFQDQVDEAALRALVEWHVQEGTQGIVVCGCTGEGALLSPQERRQVLSVSVDAAGKRIPVIMGCSSPSTAEAIQMVQEAASLGAAGALVVTPYYVKPMPEGIFRHFQEITKASPLPLIIYNNPGRVVIDLPVSLLARLATLPTVVGVKDSGTDMRRLPQLRQVVSKPFCFLSGDDPTVTAYLAKGGDGAISTTANVAPKLYQEMIGAWQKQDFLKFSTIRDRLFPLHEALLMETNPSPLKFAVSLLGKCRNEVRLPLVPVSAPTEKMVRETMAATGVLGA
ncbi:MAG: 4-hydroxy-tetrahydrodipicolinate synthase [Alphaproteobacteria bacterium]|jgi:4-hydroxy-tetrahydrodipicolinate synthase|nr:4-hydroxy-tetrahydrodipicolinate synthase [Alphaproteobacteria bacterium]